jgi:hypothetical protein
MIALPVRSRSHCDCDYFSCGCFDCDRLHTGFFRDFSAIDQSQDTTAQAHAAGRSRANQSRHHRHRPLDRICFKSEEFLIPRAARPIIPARGFN